MGNLSRKKEALNDEESQEGKVLAFLDSLQNARISGVSQETLDNFLHDIGLVSVRDINFRGIEIYKPKYGERALPIIKTLREVIPEYLAKLIALTGGTEAPVGLQFVSRPELERKNADASRTDHLEEEKYVPIDDDGQPVEGITHKFGRRVLVTFTYDCAAYCRFCTRGRKVGGELHTMPREKIDRALNWIEKNSKKHPGDKTGINEVILSGGDPLAMKKSDFPYVMQRIGDMQRAGKLDLVRIGTRYPIHDPWHIQDWHYEGIKKLVRPNIMLHINHPAEITADAVEVFDRLRLECNATLRSQTVLLKGVNDEEDVLRRLFLKLAVYQVFDYYVFLNDRNFWNDQFTVARRKVERLFYNLRRDGSGLANSFTVVDDVGELPDEGGGGFRGKLPLYIGGFHPVDNSVSRDYDGRRIGPKKQKNGRPILPLRRRRDNLR